MNKCNLSDIYRTLNVTAAAAYVFKCTCLPKLTC